MIEFLIALVLFADDVYCGQADPWYSRACVARHYLSRWYQIRDAHAWIMASYIKPEYKRRAAAIYWHLARRHTTPELYLSMKHDRKYGPTQPAHVVATQEEAAAWGY